MSWWLLVLASDLEHSGDGSGLRGDANPETTCFASTIIPFIIPFDADFQTSLPPISRLYRYARYWLTIHLYNPSIAQISHVGRGVVFVVHFQKADLFLRPMR
jgi:hypothetical protein